MTPREKYRRITAYSRASHKAHEAWKCLKRDFGCDWFGDAIDHEAHAWWRLPESVRPMLQNPAENR